MKTALRVAEYILASSNPECGDFISNLKLQKLLYYAQGSFLALYDQPLFAEELINWDHGPVVPEVYFAYKDRGSEAILPPVGMEFDDFSDEECDTISDVMYVFGQFSAWKLRDMTHEERPWKETQRNQVIPHHLLKAYFKENVIR